MIHPWPGLSASEYTKSRDILGVSPSSTTTSSSISMLLLQLDRSAPVYEMEGFHDLPFHIQERGIPSST